MTPDERIALLELANKNANAAIADIANECARYVAENKMLREQLRVSDAAFQHLFETQWAKGLSEASNT